jgi:hypothetical protein
MNESNLNVVRDYFHERLPRLEVTEKHDLDSGTQTFNIARDTGSLTVKVNQNFIDNNDANEIRNMLNKWDIVDLLKQHPEVGLLVISKGSRLL